jgi:tRNA-2-methylthio-N6-dimethylallyladenosine synthase
MILVNTCVVRKHAEDRAAGYISSLKGLKSKKPSLKIAVCGCLVTEPGVNAASLFPHVDLFIPPNKPEVLAEYLGILLSFDICHLSLSKHGSAITRYVSITHGCDNFCSYCVVPYVRGREYSRPIDEILEEIEQIDLDKHPEIFLLGQNVNSYKYGLAKLLREIEKEMVESPSTSLGASSELKVVSSKKKVAARVRFMTSHPKDMSDDIINAVAELPHVCEYFHLPVQHGDDEILKSMNRGYTAADYLKLVDKIRKKIPNAAVTSDVIVGYPGETDQQFRHTLYIIEQAGFDACNTAAYSVRPATAASRLADDVPDRVKQERLQEAMRLVEWVARKRNEKLIGTEQEILVESRGRGRTRGNKIVKFAADKSDLRGQLANVRITSAKSWILEGELQNG